MGTIDSIKLAVGYIDSHRRDACGHCAHGLRAQTHGRPDRWQCDLHQIFTTHWSTCSRFENSQPRGQR